MKRLADRRAGRLAALVLASLCACSAQTRSHAAAAGMPCTEAMRAAGAALVRLGYRADVVDAAQPGVVGRVVGHKSSGWTSRAPEPGTDYTATVSIACSDHGAEFDAVTDEPVPAALTFRSDFVAAVQSVASRRVIRPQLAERPETGVVISVEPLRGDAATAAFGDDLTTMGLTPVRVTIDNRTERTYAFAVARVQLIKQEGERVGPLTDDSITKVVSTFPAEIRQQRLADGHIASATVLSGFLYFPAAAYRGATLVLTDQATDEEEGFSVEF